MENGLRIRDKGKTSITLNKHYSLEVERMRKDGARGEERRLSPEMPCPVARGQLGTRAPEMGSEGLDRRTPRATGPGPEPRSWSRGGGSLGIEPAPSGLPWAGHFAPLSLRRSVRQKSTLNSAPGVPCNYGGSFWNAAGLRSDLSSHLCPVRSRPPTRLTIGRPSGNPGPLISHPWGHLCVSPTCKSQP